MNQLVYWLLAFVAPYAVFAAWFLCSRSARHDTYGVLTFFSFLFAVATSLVVGALGLLRLLLHVLP